MESNSATASRAMEASRAECMPCTKAAESVPDILPTPRKIENAIWREMDREAIRSAIAKLLTIPMLENVRSNPEATPYALRGALAMTALLLAGKKELEPAPVTIEPRTTTSSEDPRESVE